MRKKMYWGIVSLILIIGVVGIYFMLQPESDTEPDKKFIVPTEAELKKATEAKKPPLGASPNGHWHNGEWHDESHGVVEVSKSEVSTDVQATPVVVQQANTKIDAAILDSVGSKLKNPDVYKAWVEWSKKDSELSDQFFQAGQAFFDTMPSSEEENERFENDKEWQRRFKEALQKSGKTYTMMKEHEKDNPLFQ